VALRTLASQVPVMRKLGFDAAPIDPRIEAIEHDDWQAASLPAALGRSDATLLARARYDGPDLRGAVAETGPDVVIVDINAWGAMAAAEAWDGRWASICPYLLPVSSRQAPPFGPGFAPARGQLGRLRDRLARPVVLGTVERTAVDRGTPAIPLSAYTQEKLASSLAATMPCTSRPTTSNRSSA
jgi:hypothetical protein